MTEPDERRRVEAELLDLARVEHGHVAPDLGPAGYGTREYDQRAAAQIARVLASPRETAGRSAEVTGRRRWRRRATVAAAGLAAAAVAAGVIAWWPAGEPARPPERGLTALVVTPSPGQQTSDVLANLSRQTKPRTPTAAKATPDQSVTTVSWDGSADGQRRTTLRRTFTSGSGALTATSNADVFGRGIVAPDEVAAAATGPATSIESLTVPDQSKGQALVADVIGLAPACDGDAAYCFALGLRTWATSEVISPEAMRRVLAAMEALPIRYAGTTRDRTGRDVEAFEVAAAGARDRLVMLFGADGYVGDEVVGEGGELLAATVIVDSRYLSSPGPPRWAQ